MRWFRRKPPDPARAAILAGFEPVGERIEAAQRELLRAIPTFRDDGIPIRLALDGFLARLEDAERALVRWEAPDEVVQRCSAAIAAARAEATQLAGEDEALVFEALNARVGDVLFHLEDVADLEEQLRSGRSA